MLLDGRLFLVGHETTDVHANFRDSRQNLVLKISNSVSFSPEPPQLAQGPLWRDTPPNCPQH